MVHASLPYLIKPMPAECMNLISKSLTKVQLDIHFALDLTSHWLSAIQRYPLTYVASHRIEIEQLSDMLPR